MVTTAACTDEASADAGASSPHVLLGKLQKHVAYALGYIVVPHAALNRSTLPDNLNLKYKSFVGKDCVHKYLTSLEQDARDAFEWAQVHANKPIEKVKGMWQLKQRTTNCTLCKKLFSTIGEKYADHCHVSGKFRSIVCADRNNRVTLDKTTMPVLFRNMKNYDST